VSLGGAAESYCSQSIGTDTEILSISVNSGRAEPVGKLDGYRILTRVGAGGKTLLTNRIQTVTGREGEIATDRETSLPAASAISPDGRWIFTLRRLATDPVRQISLRPASGTPDDFRRLTVLRIQASLGNDPIPARFTPDSKWIVYHDKDLDGKDGMYRVSVPDGEVQRLGDYPLQRVC
jgi:hypothetical protein